MLGFFVTFFSKKVTPKNFLTFRFWFTLFVRPLCCADLIKAEKHTTQTIICRGRYHPPEYNKNNFRQNENLPKLFIFHYSSAKRLHYSLISNNTSTTASGPPSPTGECFFRYPLHNIQRQKTAVISKGFPLRGGSRL